MDKAPTLYLGIDPGTTGGLGWIDAEGGYFRSLPLPREPKDLADAIRSVWPHLLNRTCVLVEQQQPLRIPGKPKFGTGNQTSKVSFTHGVNYGTVLGVLGALGIAPHLVAPATWKAEQRLDSDKQRSIIRARVMWPAAPITLIGQDGQAESLLIAYHAYKHGLGASMMSL